MAGWLALASVGTGVALGASGGGIDAPRPPTVSDVTCQKGCADLRAAAAGSRVQIAGRSLGYVAKVAFNEQGGGRVKAEPRKVSENTVEAIVPDDAVTGKPKVIDGASNAAKSPETLEIVPENELASQGGVGVSRVTATPAKGYFMGKRKATASFVALGDSTQDVRVDVVRKAHGRVVRTLIAEDVEPQSPVRVRWNGKTDDRAVAPNGEYAFDVKPMGGGRGSKAGFEQYDHIFPLKGKHGYGDGLGAGRNHQGQDVFAKCGKPIIAARAGRVQNKAYHSRAGNYVVIDGKKTNVDYVYMHLQRPAKVKEGDRVKTGQRIGRNGDTGNASGCHLHFEMWDGDWYGGGKVMSPTRHLKRWDGWS